MKALRRIQIYLNNNPQVLKDYSFPDSHLDRVRFAKENGFPDNQPEFTRECCRRVGIEWVRAGLKPPVPHGADAHKKLSQKSKKTITDLGLTDLENKFINTLIPLLYAEEGFTDVDVNDIAKAMNISINSAKGVLGSLVKKGIVDAIEADHSYITTEKNKLKSKKEVFDLVVLNYNYYYLHPNWDNNY